MPKKNKTLDAYSLTLNKPIQIRVREETISLHTEDPNEETIIPIEQAKIKHSFGCVVIKHEDKKYRLRMNKVDKGQTFYWKISIVGIPAFLIVATYYLFIDYLPRQLAIPILILMRTMTFIIVVLTGESSGKYTILANSNENLFQLLMPGALVFAFYISYVILQYRKLEVPGMGHQLITSFEMRKYQKIIEKTQKK